MAKKKIKIDWWKLFGLGQFIGGWIISSLMEKRNPGTGEIISPFGTITRDELDQLIDGVLDQAAQLTGLDEINVIS